MFLCPNLEKRFGWKKENLVKGLSPSVNLVYAEIENGRMDVVEQLRY